MLVSRWVAATFLMTLPVSAFASDVNQVSVEILSNQQSSMTVAPGPVDLELDLRMSTNIGLTALELALDCSSPSVFVYASPTVTIGSPFTQADLDFVPITPAADDGTPLSEHPLMTFFRMSPGNYPVSKFPSVIVTLHIRSVQSLTAGTSHTFTLKEENERPLWINDDGSVGGISGRITVGASGTFTLHVSGDGSGGTSPGDGGTTPNDGGTTPGDGGTTPGDGGTTPGDGGTTPTDGGTTPSDGGTTPGGGGTTPGDGGATPGEGGTTPGDGGTTPGDNSDQPSESTPTSTGTVAFCGAGTNPVLMLMAMISLWVIIPRPRIAGRARP